jgi:excinuclease ABC subunit C
MMKDRLGHVIYVGKAKSLRKRLSNYFTPARSRMADLKTRALIHSIWDFEIHVVRNETEALLLEGKLIKQYRPKYNVSFRDDKRFLMLRIHLAEPWPKFQLSRLKKEDGAKYFGPFAHGGALKNALNRVIKEFGIRSCRPLRPGEADYKHCSNEIIRNCSAPCVGKVTREEYLHRVEQACAVLDGKGRDFIEEMEAEMLKAAESLDFEKAAQLRDMLADFRKTTQPVRKFTRGRGVVGDGIVPLDDVAELQEALGLTRPPLVMECFDISNISSNHIVASMVRFTGGKPDNRNYRRYRIKTVEGQNDFASMAEVVRRRYSRILLEARELLGEDEAYITQEDPIEALRRLEEEVEESDDVKKRTRFVRLPDLVIVDGGKGQLSSAVEELQRLGLHDLPIIGLAKEHEEIYRPGESLPVVLSHDMGALKLLQRIRDEAHRFANGYHQILMKRRVEESILDDCPGVSEARKMSLLKRFGSLTRLRKVSEEELAAVPGVSKKLAHEIVSFLQSH